MIMPLTGNSYMSGTGGPLTGRIMGNTSNLAVYVSVPYCGLVWMNGTVSVTAISLPSQYSVSGGGTFARGLRHHCNIEWLSTGINYQLKRTVSGYHDQCRNNRSGTGKQPHLPGQTIPRNLYRDRHDATDARDHGRQRKSHSAVFSIGYNMGATPAIVPE